MRILLILFCSASLFAQQRVTPQYTYKIVRTFPHDRTAYTQGLEFHNGVLYEGTGLNGRSTLRKVKLETGEVLQRIALQPEYFGEGITLFRGEILQLTWRNQTGFIYNASDFGLRRRFSYAGEGWGLTNDGQQLYMSDGTEQIRVLDPASQAEKKRIRVLDRSKPVASLNELEWVEGEILANIYTTDQIVKISPRTGAVTGRVDLTGLLGPMFRTGEIDVLNGIAYDPARKRLFVTGKLWPLLFEIQLVRKLK